MVTLSAETEALLSEFSRTPSVTPEQVSNLRSVIEGSPQLATQVDAAIGAGHLQHFALLPSTVSAGGTYDGRTKTINLPAATLAAPDGERPHDAAELTFVLGHEIQHGFNHAATTQAYAQFERELGSARSTDHDYTRAIGNIIATNRRDEAEANIAGWNALVGKIRQENPDATLEDVYLSNGRAKDVIKLHQPGLTYEARSNLALNQDLTITPSPANIEGMAENYFDKPGDLARLGHGRNSDYTNYYGAYAVGRASQYEALSPAPDGRVRMTINMQQLGLQESLLEQNGITLGAGTPAPQPYYDSSTTPPTLHHFDHTASTHAHVPIAAREFAGLPIQAHDMPLPNAADRALHEQIRDKVAALDAANGRSFDATSERLSASLLVVARENGLDRVDHVVLSRQTADAAAAQNIFVVRGALDDPAALRASTDTAEAAQRPVAESMQQLQNTHQRVAESTAQEQTQQRTQEQQRGALSH